MMKNTADVEFQPLGKNIFSKIPVGKHVNKTNLVHNANLSKFKDSNSKGSGILISWGAEWAERVQLSFPVHWAGFN